MSRTIIFDAEANHLLRQVHTCWCISTYCIEDKQALHFGPDEIEDGLRYLATATCLVGHNICNYDLPMFLKLYNWVVPENTELVDTLLLDCLLFPEEQHSLEKIADRLHLKQQKVAHEDWSKYSPDMRWRCDSDVIINTQVYEYLIARSGYADMGRALNLEQEVAWIHARQTVHGVMVDVQAGIKLYRHLQARLTDLEDEITKDVPPEVRISALSVTKAIELRHDLECIREDKAITAVSSTKEELEIEENKLLLLGVQAKTKNGQYTKNNTRYFGAGIPEVEDIWTERIEVVDLLQKLHSENTQDVKSVVDLEKMLKELDAEEDRLLNGVRAEGPYNKIEFQYLNLNSPDQVKKYLLSLGWVPTEFNHKKVEGRWVQTGPKLTEDSYKSLPDGVGKSIATYNILKHRKGLILTIRKKDKAVTGILGGVWQRGNHGVDPRIGSDGFTCGTNTGRYRHFGVANIPRPSTKYGGEIRALFTVPEGSWMLGVDLSGIEAVVLAHYCMKYPGGQALVDEILKGDFHQANADLWSVDRNTAKSVLYALMYGASGKKLAAIAGRKESEGQAIKDTFYEAYPAIKELVSALEKSLKHTGNWIRTLDGRRTYVRQDYKLLNTLIQSTAAQIFKAWMFEVNEELPLWAKQIIAYHDELQFECKCKSKLEAEVLGERICELAIKVGKQLDICVPVTAEAKVGKNWEDCH